VVQEPAVGSWLLALGAALFAISLMVVARDVSHWNTPDLVIYRHAGLTALHSGPLYTRSFGPGNFNYPPFAALMFVTLAVPLAGARWLMTGTSMVALALSAWAIAGVAGVRKPTIRVGAALVIAWAAVWADPVMSVLTWGQIDLVVLAITLGDLCVRDDRWWKGAGVGLAAGIKITPAIFILYLLLTRRYRAAFAATTAFGVTVLVSFAALPGSARQFWLGGLFPHQQRVGDASAVPDQSLDGLITRLAGSGGLVWLAAVVFVGITGLALAALAHRRGLDLLGIVTCAVTGLLVSPISWDHHWVWIIPLPVAGIAAIRDRGATPGTACLVAISALFLDYPIFSGTQIPSGRALDGLIWGIAGNPHDWHGLQLITGNLYVLAGLAILGAVALVIAETPPARLLAP
jgi:alpha-1,2-mannosyltransferase